jgi:hypothetical protein
MEEWLKAFDTRSPSHVAIYQLHSQLHNIIFIRFHGHTTFHYIGPNTWSLQQKNTSSATKKNSRSHKISHNCHCSNKYTSSAAHQTADSMGEAAAPASPPPGRASSSSLGTTVPRARSARRSFPRCDTASQARRRSSLGAAGGESRRRSGSPYAAPVFSKRDRWGFQGRRR